MTAAEASRSSNRRSRATASVAIAVVLELEPGVNRLTVGDPETGDTMTVGQSQGPMERLAVPCLDAGHGAGGEKARQVSRRERRATVVSPTSSMDGAQSPATGT